RLVDVIELGIAIRVVCSLAGLAVGLQTVAQPAQQPANLRMADAMAQLVQGLGNLPQALDRPAQRLLGIAARGRRDNPLQVGDQFGIDRRQLFAATACARSRSPPTPPNPPPSPPLAPPPPQTSDVGARPGTGAALNTSRASLQRRPPRPHTLHCPPRQPQHIDNIDSFIHLQTL